MLDVSTPCSVQHGTGSCSVAEVSATGENSTLNWIRISGDISSNDGSVQIVASGNASGFAAGESIPISWDFSVATPDPGIAFFWRLQFDLDTTDGVNDPLEDDFSISNQEISGKDVLLLPAGEARFWSLSLSVSTSPQSPLSVHIPAETGLNFNATPEPSSLLLTAAGVAALLFSRKIYAKTGTR